VTPLEVILTTALVLACAMTALWLISLAIRDSSIVDIFWGPGFVLVTWVVFALTPGGFLPRRLLISTLVTIWGLRLGLHILRRNLGKGEDFRYAAWRREAGDSWWWKSLLRVFALQGVILLFVAAPIFAAQILRGAERWTWLDTLAIPVWLFGFFFESVGDWQLARFKADPANRGKLLDGGVWRYTRHPNYFGDAAQWWGHYLVAAATGGGAWTILSPILMTFLLVRVSGVGLLEKSLKDSKPGYRAYMETTSAFVPWFPRRRG
jgi:steroid 5-alpha reductase family enzyme